MVYLLSGDLAGLAADGSWQFVQLPYIGSLSLLPLYNCFRAEAAQGRAAAL